ncbi:MAG: CobW family GTP-binding protein [Lachnospiraceae bacterium]
MLNKEKTPVTIITGYLGSGKTTLLNELLKSQENEGLALIVNDMGSVNIDASLIKKNRAIEADAKMIELSNGCICCTLQEAFMDQIVCLSKDSNVRRILVEASGISNPASIAEGFLAYQDLQEKATFYLDSIVTVVDADRIYAEFLEDLKEVEAECQEDDPDIINLVMDQIEFCNVVLLNKCDLLSENQIKEVRDVIRSLQKEAKIIPCIYGKVEPDCIFCGETFDFDKVMNSSVMQQALAREQKMEQNDQDEYGITSFVFEERKPLDYDKFMEFVEQDYPEEIVRAKGYIWFADDDIHVQLFEQAGRNASVSEVSNWVAAFEEKEKQEVFENYPEVLDDWDEIYGDRMNQIVFIGRGYDKEQILQTLKQCVVER